MSESKNVNPISQNIGAFRTTGKKMVMIYEMKCFDNMAKIHATSSESKGKASNDQKQFQDFLIEIIVNILSPLIVSTSSDFP